MSEEIKKGLLGIVVDETTISHVVPELSALTYRGYTVQELCDKCDFEEVAYLVLNGELPNKSQLKKFIKQERSERKLSKQILNRSQLENLGYNLVIYPVTTQRLAMQNVELGLKSIFKDGHQNNIIDKMQTRKRLYELVEYEKYNTPDKKITDFSTEGHE